MPELPDIAVYLYALDSRIVGQRLERALLKNPFLLRTADPPLQACQDREVVELRRIGKRIAIGFDNDLWILIHLMIAGRLHWYGRDHRGRVRSPLLLLEFQASPRLAIPAAGSNGCAATSPARRWRSSGSPSRPGATSATH